MQRNLSRTEQYYEREAQGYAEQTRGLDMHRAYKGFLSRLAPGARVLDAGCGSGRDARAFQELGYDVDAMDASAALAREAEHVLGKPVRVGRHQDVDIRDTYDGIWCAATLLHVPREEMGDVFRRYSRALRDGGILYASFKVGSGDGEDALGRWFTRFDEKSFRVFIEESGSFTIEELKVEPDVSRHDTSWLAVVLRKVDE